jgi:hypothetical protein
MINIGITNAGTIRTGQPLYIIKKTPTNISLPSFVNIAVTFWKVNMRKLTDAAIFA